jgi:hypothetical protein
MVFTERNEKGIKSYKAMEIKSCFELVEIVKMIQLLMEEIFPLCFKCFFHLKEFFHNETKRTLTF